MTWGKVDDRLHRHRKVRKAKLEAMGLWVIALSYCADNLTDGYLDDDEVLSLCDGDRHAAKRASSRLVEVGLWERLEDGRFHFHDWADWEPLRDQVISERARKSEGGRRGAQLRWHGADVPPVPKIGDVMARAIAPPNGVTHGASHRDPTGGRDAPDPDPDPVPDQISPGTGSSPARAGATGGPVPVPDPAPDPAVPIHSNRREIRSRTRSTASAAAEVAAGVANGLHTSAQPPRNGT